MLIVSNTSPLSNLAVIGEISILQQIYPKILIPPIVYTELINFPKIQPTIASLVNLGWLELQAPKNLQFIQTFT